MNGEKPRGLFGELWHFISGEWVAEARASERKRMEQEINAMEEPDCGDKHRHYMQMTSDGYCIDCRAVHYLQREKERKEELADMIAKRVLAGLKDQQPCT